MVRGEGSQAIVLLPLQTTALSVDSNRMTLQASGAWLVKGRFAWLDHLSWRLDTRYRERAGIGAPTAAMIRGDNTKNATVDTSTAPAATSPLSVYRVAYM